MTRQKVQGVVLAAAVAAAAVACTNTSTAEGPQPTVVDSLPPPGADDDAASPTPDEDTESPGAGFTVETDASDASDDESDVEPDEDPTPIPASSEGPAQNWPAPEIPEEIYEPTQEGAEALIQYWFDVRHYARITGDTEPWRDASHESCEVCSGHFDRVESAYPDAWFVESDPDVVFDMSVMLESEDSATGIFAHRSVPFKAYREGELDSGYEGGTESNFGIAFIYVDGMWQVLDLTYLGEYGEESGG